jgi:hypothetical protein
VHLPDFLEVTVIKGKKILVLIIKTLDIMGNTLREVPNVTSLQDLSCETAILVNSGKEQGAIVNKTPLSLYGINISVEVGNRCINVLTTLCQ